MIALMYWANDVSCVRCRDYRHDVLIGVTTMSRESGASTKQQVSRIYCLDRSRLPTYLPTYLPTRLPAATLLDITYSLQLVNLLLLPSYIYLQS